ncbi:hypothetical protein [Pontibacter kalidii]|uniref:hypothetical protein n=1 Tax=Pontibacter kalidii TaxID=2592049 RepID=UPI00224CAEE0|nr:hypothetical protein [Pontibacter kalidii]
MKTLLPKLLLFIFVVAFFSSCQQSYCPAYASHKDKPLYKPTFLKDHQAARK